MNNTTIQTMSSREIAELTGERHDHVMRDIKVMLEDLGEDVPKFGEIYLDAYGREQKGYELPKRETLILVSGYSVVLRSRIIDRWQELEAQAASTPSIPTNYAEALRVAADEYERRLAAEQRAKELEGPATFNGQSKNRL